MGGGLNFKVENTVFDLKVKCTACNNEHTLHAQRKMLRGGTCYDGYQVTFGIERHLKSCTNRIKLQAQLAAPPPRGVTKFARNGQLSITRVEPPTP